MKITYQVTETKIQNKVTITTGLVKVGDKVWQACSGGWDSGNSAAGTIPFGVYVLTGATKLADEPKNEQYKGDGYPWYIHIEPKGFKTTRTGLLFHGKGKWIGTFGCIEISSRDVSFFETVSAIMKKETVELVVI